MGLDLIMQISITSRMKFYFYFNGGERVSGLVIRPIIGSLHLRSLLFQFRFVNKVETKERERERKRQHWSTGSFWERSSRFYGRSFDQKERGGVAGNARGSATMRCRASVIDTCALESETKKQTTNEKCQEPRDGCCCTNSRPAASLFHANFC